MGNERGQASVELIALIALVAISLGAMARLARRDEDHALGATLAHSVACAARDGCGRAQVVGIRSGTRTGSEAPRIAALSAPRPRRRGSVTAPRQRGRKSFIAPPLVPVPGPAGSRPGIGQPPAPRVGQPIGRPLLEWARRQVGRELAGPLRRLPPGVLGDRAGRAWRSAWFACLVYERVRWAILHPESRSHEYELPPAEAVRMLNDCISPLDLVRDWSLITDR
jgi:hypothetical protein